MEEPRSQPSEQSTSHRRLSDLHEELVALKFRIVSSTEEEVVAVRTRFHLECLATWVTYVVFARVARDLTATELETASVTLWDRARDVDPNRLPGGLQKGRLILSLWLADGPSAEAIEWARKTRPRFAQFLVTGILDRSTGQVHGAESMPLIGAVYHSKSRFLVDRLLGGSRARSRRWPLSVFGLFLSLLVVLALLAPFGLLRPVRAELMSVVNLLGRGSSRIEGIVNPTDLVASSYWFCALNSEGVLCWDPSPRATQSTPEKVGGLVHPQHLAIVDDTGCAIDDGAIKCWNLRQRTGARVVAGTNGAVDLVAAAHNFCGFVAGRVLCWSHDEAPTAMAGLRNPTKLFPSLTRDSFCVRDEEGLKCFAYRKHENPPYYQPTFWVRGFNNVLAVSANDYLHRVVVLDEGRVMIYSDITKSALSRRGEERRTGFAEPVELEPLMGLSNPRELVESSIWMHALDDTGVVKVDPGGKYDRVERTVDGKSVWMNKGGSLHGKRLEEPQGPTRLWSGRSSDVYTRDEKDGTRLRCSGWNRGTRETFVVRGVDDPRKIVQGLDQACAINGAEVRYWDAPSY